MLETKHIILNKSSGIKGGISEIEDGSISLVVTSPPYPMIEMWDECFNSQNHKVADYLSNNEGYKAFLEMHKVLDATWDNVSKAVRPGGIVCINIGDATRTVGNTFQLFSNKTKITEYFLSHGFVALPEIIWRKKTNSPNKFMGSGMLPPGAYVTLEHEHILIFRKGNKREFTVSERLNRQESAYFYIERNAWFSDLWELAGTTQKGIKGSRERSGAYPLALPYRLVLMFSVYGDTVLDPFSGLGTTNLACAILGRNSIGCEIDKALCAYSVERMVNYNDWEHYNTLRLLSQDIDKGEKKYYNNNLGIPVRTKGEENIKLVHVDKVVKNHNQVTVYYK